MSNYDDEVLKAAYKRAWLRADRGFVNPRDYPELDRAVQAYAIRNHCSYDEAFIFAKTGQKMGSLKEQENRTSDFHDTEHYSQSSNQINRSQSSGGSGRVGAIVIIGIIAIVYGWLCSMDPSGDPIIGGIVGGVIMGGLSTGIFIGMSGDGSNNSVGCGSFFVFFLIFFVLGLL